MYVHAVASHNLLIECINFAFYSIKIRLVTRDSQKGELTLGKGGRHCEGGVHTVASLDILIE